VAMHSEESVSVTSKGFANATSVPKYERLFHCTGLTGFHFRRPALHVNLTPCNRMSQRYLAYVGFLPRVAQYLS